MAWHRTGQTLPNLVQLYKKTLLIKAILTKMCPKIYIQCRPLCSNPNVLINFVNHFAARIICSQSQQLSSPSMPMWTPNSPYVGVRSACLCQAIRPMITPNVPQWWNSLISLITIRSSGDSRSHPSDVGFCNWFQYKDFSPCTASLIKMRQS